MMIFAIGRLRVPYAILLVLGGLALGFVPGLPRLALPPDLVLVALLPPLLYSTAFFTSLRDLRENIRPISFLALGLVGATMVGVAVVAHTWIDSFGWPEAFVLGAVVSPTDAIAATSIARRLGVPRSIVSIIEGESLVNDGTALVFYRFAVAAVVSGTFSLAEASGRLILNAAGGVAVGLVVGFLIREVRRRMPFAPTSISIALLTGYFAYLPADALRVSGVLAVVTAGVYMGWHTPLLTTVETRLQGAAFWEILTFVLNSLLFLLVGLQLPTILDELGGRAGWTLVLDGALVSAAVIVVRLLWVFPFTYGPRLLSRRLRERSPAPPWQHAALAGWAGLRGGISLAAALAIPLTTNAGAPFPERNLIVFLVFCVILATLVGQGLTLPLLIRVLGVEDDGIADREEAKARIKAAEAALARLEELEEEEWVREDTAERMRGLYGFRRDRFRARFDSADDGGIEERSADYQRLRRELLEAERQAVVGLRNAGYINDESMYRVTRDLDLEDSRLEI
ncbi:MAG: monovalent cation/hydrogen antiporter [Gaiellaceae bacterium]|jgi:CPA1 family monovalent cation:H+ antiporter|nr:monovalent cation/hydrogen antiporter [Gaiellaceae bacterium]